MSPVLYATIDEQPGMPASYRGIVVEDVQEDYKEVARFCGPDFATDVNSYIDWVNTTLSKHESAEIYESDVLRAKMQLSTQ